MILEIRKLLTRKSYEGSFEFDYAPAAEKLMLPLCEVDGAVKVSGEYEIYDDDSVEIRFRLSYKLKGQCSYCLAKAEKEVEYSSEVLFVTEKDDDNYYYDGMNLDLTEAVDDAFIFSQPNVLLCKDGCGGVEIN